MKFTLTALLAAVGFTQAKKLVNKKALLRNAIPVDKNGNRRLEQNEFQITGEYSIKFNHCLSLKIAADNYEDVMFDENLVQYTAEGKIVAQTSYVLFSVCQTENCYYEDDESLYMVDLPTYMGSLIEGYQQKEENYCQACQESYETCYPNQDEQGQDNGEENNQDENNGEEDNNQEENNGEEDNNQEENNEGENNEGENNGEDGEDNNEEGGRRLDEAVYYDGQGYLVVDCDTCDAKGCFEEDEQQQYDENNANYQITDEVIQQWVENMLGCVDTEIAGAVDNLYAGFVCNADGTGVEPAIFLDNGCAVYTSMYAYGTLMSGTNNYEIMYKAADIVMAPFESEGESCEYIEVISIEDAENLAYEAAQQAYDGNNNNNQNQDQNEEGAQAAEICQQLMQEAIDLDTCGGYEADDQGEDEDEDVDEQADYDYSWYTYLVAADAADDVQGSCVVVAALQGEFSTAHTYTEDDGEGGGSGHVYDYKNSGAFGGGKMSAGKIFGIIIAVIVVIVAAVLIMQSMGGKKDSKKVPLVNNKNGAMA